MATYPPYNATISARDQMNWKVQAEPLGTTALHEPMEALLSDGLAVIDKHLHELVDILGGAYGGLGELESQMLGPTPETDRAPLPNLRERGADSMLDRLLAQLDVINSSTECLHGLASAIDLRQRALHARVLDQRRAPPSGATGSSRGG